LTSSEADGTVCFSDPRKSVQGQQGRINRLEILSIMNDVRVAVVTGAASGIGAATAKCLARGGYHVWLADLRVEGAVDVAREIGATGGNSFPVEIDVCEPMSVKEAFATVTAENAAIDVLVNSAGIIAVCPFEAASQELWERTYRTNVVGTYLCLQAALPALRAASPPARVVNLSSAAGKLPGVYTAPYNASKAAVISLTRTAAVALAPDILVNCVCPGVIDTPMWVELDASLADIGAGPETQFKERAMTVPTHRAGTAEEVANVIAFMLSPAAAYVTGEDLNVSGGLVMH
jgi:NAD(P)-dependent dehydrogenase (short-subunit alcohol dehydrogenase family)